MGSKQPDFLFVTYTSTDRPNRESKQEALRKVRKHVMVNYFHQRGGKDPRRHAAQKLPSAGRLLHANFGSKSGAAVPQRRPCEEEPQHVETTSPTFPESCTSFAVKRIDEQPFEPHFYNPLNYGLSVHRLDPFDALPLSETLDQSELIRYYYNYHEVESWERDIPWLQQYDDIYKKSQWDVSRDHEGLFHLMLCIGQARRTLVKGYPHKNTLYYHRSEATRYICERQADQNLDDSFLMLICGLARISLADEEDATAALHVDAVRKLLATNSTTVRRAQWRIISWTDLRLASTLLQKPLLDYRMQHTKTQVPAELLMAAELHTAKTMDAVQGCGMDIFGQEAEDLLLRLHVQSEAYTSGNCVFSSTNDALEVMQGVPYETMYSLSVLVADQAKTPFSPAQAILLAMRIYAWSCVPEYIPEQAGVKVCYGPLMKRVSAQALKRLYHGFSQPTNLPQWWRSQTQQSTLEPLFWVLFVAWSVARIETRTQYLDPMPKSEATDWLQEKLQEVAFELELKSKIELENVLRKFPWVNHFCARNCDEFWKLQMRFYDVHVMSAEQQMGVCEVPVIGTGMQLQQQHCF